MASLFQFFSKTKVRNIAVVDISTASVGAAFATISGIAPPAIVFSSRFENQAQGGGTAGMLRALDAVCREMIEKGVPLLKKTTGTGGVESITILVGSPRQTSSISVDVIEQDKPFIFSEAMLHAALGKKSGHGCTTTLIASVLNGYETQQPIGKRTSKAEVVLLSCCLDPEIESFIKRAVRTFSGGVPLRFVSFPNAAHLVLQGLFPHERDFLAFSVGNETTEIAFIKQGHLAGIETAAVGTDIFAKAAKENGINTPSGVVDMEKGLIDKEKSARLSARLLEGEQIWVHAIKEALLKIASQGALPRVVFLFSDARTLTFFKRLLDSPELHALWLSDEPLSVMPVGKRQFYQFMRHVSAPLQGAGSLQTLEDPILDMIALLSRVQEDGVQGSRVPDRV